MHEPNRLLHELHVAESERDRLLAELATARAWACRLEAQVAWMTASYIRNCDDPVAMIERRGYALFDGQGLA